MTSSDRNIKLLIEYDGGAYVGWQRQENGPSIEGALAKALVSLGVENPAIQVAGRTDAGVHALGQVANFFTSSKIPSERFAAALNTKLPRDISIHEACEVSPSFNARTSARGKRYRYTVYTARQPAALIQPRAWHKRRPLDVAAMIEASRCLLGELDFEAFRSAHCDAPHARRKMHAIDITSSPRPPRGELYEIVFFANAFCRHMCRILAGTLIEVGEGRRTSQSVLMAIQGRRRELAGITAPARGLTLLEILYP